MSGWLASLPSTWRRFPAWAVFTERGERSEPEDEHLTPSQQYGVLPQTEYMKLAGNRVVLNLSGSDNMKAARVGDFIIHLRSFQGGIEASGVNGKVSTAYTVLKPTSVVEVGYFRYLLKSEVFIEQLVNLTDQLRDGQSINYGRFARLELPVPPHAAQRRLADFLDRELAEIDAMDAELNHLIQTLQERRTTLVARSVRLHAQHDELPPGWKRIPFKLAVETRFTGEWGNEPGIGEVDVQCVRVADFDRAGRQAGHVIPTTRSIARAKAVAKALRPGDLLLERSGGSGKNPVGNVFLYVGPQGVVSSNFVECIRLLPGHDSRFWCYVQEAAYGTGFTHVHVRQSTGIQNLDAQGFYDEFFAAPALDDQRRIAAELDKQTARIDDMIADANRLKALLAERRSTLITDVVTGKKEVPA